MQTSPVQTRSILFRRVNIVPVLDGDERPKPGLRASSFKWVDVNFDILTGIGVRDDQRANPLEFFVSLQLKVNNEKGTECPYSFDVEAVALLELNEDLPPARREELAEVDGLAIVYGALRELVTTLTARMEYGPLVLPGVNFQDHATRKAIGDSSRKAGPEALADVNSPPIVTPTPKSKGVPTVTRSSTSSSKS